MKNFITRLLVSVATLAAALVFVKLMHDMNSSMTTMSSSMTEMTAYVGSLSRDVASMNANVEQMALNVAEMGNSIRRIEGSMQGMGQAISEGSEQFQQWNPTMMMRQVIPEDGRQQR